VVPPPAPFRPPPPVPPPRPPPHPDRLRDNVLLTQFDCPNQPNVSRIVWMWDQCGGRLTCGTSNFTNCIDIQWPDFCCSAGFTCKRQSEW
jgi:hypothetical protein